MARTKHNRTETKNSEEIPNNAFMSVDKNAFDPGLASLFASSVSVGGLRNLPNFDDMANIY
jgi:hypothetical protein